jgi:hypothetical protein
VRRQDVGSLSPKRGAPGEVRYVGDQIVGLQKPEWLPFSPLATNLEILTPPVARIRVAANQPFAELALRLCEVPPQGKSCFIEETLRALEQEAVLFERTNKIGRRARLAVRTVGQFRATGGDHVRLRRPWSPVGHRSAGIQNDRERQR